MDPDMSLLQTLIYLYTWVIPLRNIFVGCASHIDGWLYLEELNQKGLYSCLHRPKPVDGFDRTLFHHPLQSFFPSPSSIFLLQDNHIPEIMHSPNLQLL